MLFKETSQINERVRRQNGIVLRGFEILLLVFLSASSVSAQTGFRELAENAREFSAETQELTRHLFEPCVQQTRPQRRNCQRRQRAVEREMRASTWLISMPALGRVEIGPYEVVREGFLIRVPSLSFAVDGGTFTTYRPENRGEETRVLAQQFNLISPNRMERWFRRNRIDRLRLRIVFHVEQSWRHENRQGYQIRPLGIQVYNESTGNVLLDSSRTSSPPPGGPIDLTARITLWDTHQLREARWATPNHEVILFSVRVDPQENGNRTLVLVETRGITTRDLARFDTGRQETSLAVLPRNSESILVVFTEQRPNLGTSGRGIVHLYEWHENSLSRTQQWQGTNEQTPPAWVVPQ